MVCQDILKIILHKQLELAAQETIGNLRDATLLVDTQTLEIWKKASLPCVEKKLGVRRISMLHTYDK